jgi:hypothetical protein
MAARINGRDEHAPVPERDAITIMTPRTPAAQTISAIKSSIISGLSQYRGGTRQTRPFRTRGHLRSRFIGAVWPGRTGRDIGQDRELSNVPRTAGTGWRFTNARTARVRRGGPCSASAAGDDFYGRDPLNVPHFLA